MSVGQIDSEVSSINKPELGPISFSSSVGVVTVAAVRAIFLH